MPLPLAAGLPTMEAWTQYNSSPVTFAPRPVPLRIAGWRSYGVRPAVALLLACWTCDSPSPPPMPASLPINSTPLLRRPCRSRAGYPPVAHLYPPNPQAAHLCGGMPPPTYTLGGILDLRRFQGPEMAGIGRSWSKLARIGQSWTPHITRPSRRNHQQAGPAAPGSTNAKQSTPSPAKAANSLKTAGNSRRQRKQGDGIPSPPTRLAASCPAHRALRLRPPNTVQPWPVKTRCWRLYSPVFTAWRPQPHIRTA